jgi:hypothetical protein
MVFQSLGALCLAPGGPGGIWIHMKALVRFTGVTGRCGCGFRTDLHFADASSTTTMLLNDVNNMSVIRYG